MPFHPCSQKQRAAKKNPKKTGLAPFLLDFRGALVVKNPPASAGDAGDTGSIPGLGRSPGVGSGNPLQYSCLENSMERGA